MPLSKNIGSYPQNFFTLAENLRLLKGEEVVPFQSEGQAIKTRQQLYGFAAALEHFISEHPKNPLCPEYQALCNAIRSTEIRLRGSNLIFVLRFDTASYNAIEGLIERLSGQQCSTAIQGTPEEYFARTEERLSNDAMIKKFGYSTGIGEKDCTTEERKQEAPAIDLNEFVDNTSKANQAYKEFMARTSNNNTNEENT